MVNVGREEHLYNSSRLARPNVEKRKEQPALIPIETLRRLNACNLQKFISNKFPIPREKIVDPPTAEHQAAQY